MEYRLVFTIAGLMLLLSGCMGPNNFVAPVILQPASFTTWVEIKDVENKITGNTFFAREDPGKWELKLWDGGVERSHWVGVEGKVYVRDYTDSMYWEVTDQGLWWSSVMDFRSWTPEAKFILEGTELCGTTQCTKYRVWGRDYESSRERIGHVVWIDQQTGELLQQQLKGDTGSAIATYSAINSTKIVVPLITKPADSDADLFLLPGSITATYAAEMRLKGLALPWPFMPTN